MRDDLRLQRCVDRLPLPAEPAASRALPAPTARATASAGTATATTRATGATGATFGSATALVAATVAAAALAAALAAFAASSSGGAALVEIPNQLSRKTARAGGKLRAAGSGHCGVQALAAPPSC